MLTVTLNNPNKAPGKQLGVFGLGVMVNGEPRQLTSDDESAYYAATGNNIVDLDGKNGFSIEGTSEYVIASHGTVETPFGGDESPPVVPFIPQERTEIESEVTN